MHDRLLNFIDGRWVPSTTGRETENRNPATGDSLGTMPLSGADDVEIACQAAQRAFRSWRKTPAPKRAEVVFNAWRLLGERAEQVAMALSLEEGKTLNEARGEVSKTRSLLEFLAGEGRRLWGQVIPSEMPNTQCWTMREPIGVVGLITPWNFPVSIPFWKSAPALIAGNTVILKTAEQTPWTGTLLAQIYADAGVPPGVLNVLQGWGHECGAAIVEHPGIKAISFTGSTEVGTAIYTKAAPMLKKVQAEMGGKNPIIVLEDADVELAAAAAVAGAFGSTGQRCTATSRALVHRSVYNAFIECVVYLTRKIKVGLPLDPTTQMGPVVDEAQLQKVLLAVENAKNAATLVLGGRRLTEGAYAAGYFVEPTVFVDVQRDSQLANEEVFGPVLAILPVDGIDDALTLANRVRYGLSSSVYTRDIGSMFRYLDEIESGITHINSSTVGGEAQIPFGGMKSTGIGPREMGPNAIEFFTEVKSVYVDYTGTARTGNTY
ncbi:MAG: aldehyde dehydrogenase family protein [Myxococcales bacterium]|nr:aldehyde dehydrogenase family protein [Myxococcales bacterium]